MPGDPTFAPPAAQLGTPQAGAIPVAAAPSGGRGLALDPLGRIPRSALAAWPYGIDVPTTVTDLNALYQGAPSTGAPGLIRVGSSPYDYVSLVYDANTGKWVEEDADLMVSLLTTFTTTSTAYALAAPGPLMPHKIYTDAGLVLNARIKAMLTAGVSSSVQVACLVSTANVGSALALDTTNVTGAASSSTTSSVDADGGWTAISGSITPKDDVSLSIGAKRTGANNGTVATGTALWMRWTS